MKTIPETNMDKCYSCDEENFSHSSIEDAAQDLWEGSDDHKVGDIVTIWEGDPVRHTAGGLVPNMADELTERAYDEIGEHSDTWEFSREEEKSLQEAVEKTVNEWADANNMQPRFWGIINTREIKVRFTGENGECEEVTP